MHKLIALLLLIAGYSPSDREIVVRASENGVDTLYSRVHITELSAHFECLASTSGLCHYALFTGDCASNACDDPPLREFALGAGGEREIAGLPHDVLTCVRREAGAIAASCLHPQQKLAQAP